MLPTPSSSPRAPLHDSTNTKATLPHPKLRAHVQGLPTPKSQDKKKRPSAGHKERVAKRAKTDASDDEDEDIDDGGPVKCVQKMHMAAAVTDAISSLSRHRIRLTTRPILQSFVSSTKSDVYRCPSQQDNYFTIPYACAYSNDAKNGKMPLLAVGTEEGSVHVMNTTKRLAWDAEPKRAILYPHGNAIFDVKWSPSCGLLATCSGDQSTRVSCVTSQQTLHTLRGHAGTVKCLAWDPAHCDVLSSGGRDGAILIWDLRVSTARDQDGVCRPVITVPAGHGEEKRRGRKGNVAPPSRSITSLLYAETEPHGIISSSACDGILRHWDTRFPTPKARSSKPKTPVALQTTLTDPTTLHGRRARGIISLALGTGPTSGLIFALGADSRIHTYALPTLEPLTAKVYTHPNMQTNSFYVRLASSPCGRWLASGCGGITGSVFLLDVSDAHRAGPVSAVDGEPVELRGQMGEVGALDWAEDMLASCADDGTVRTWRPDVEVYKTCLDNEKEASYDWAWALPGSGIPNKP